MMNKFLFFSMLFLGLLTASCTSSKGAADAEDASTTPTQTSAVVANKAVLDIKQAQPVPAEAKKKIIKSNPKPAVAKKASKPIEDKVIKKTKKVVVKATKPIKQAPKEVVKSTPKKVIAAAITKKVVTKADSKVMDKIKSKAAQITLEEPRYNFGTIKEGVIIKRDFKFTNTGGEDLIIEIATGSCGCTVPEWPIKPIKPGQSEVIHVTFDSTDKEYDTRVEVNIVANTEPIVTEIIMTGKVIPKRDFKKKNNE